MDSRANHYLISEKSNISNAALYSGNERVMLGNGKILPITPSGSSMITFGCSPLKLNNLLYVLCLVKNLIFVHQLYTDNHIIVYFILHTFMLRTCIRRHLNDTRT